MGGAYIAHFGRRGDYATLEDTHGKKRPCVRHPEDSSRSPVTAPASTGRIPRITPMGASCHSAVSRRNKKQILRLLESDARLRAGLGGLH